MSKSRREFLITSSIALLGAASAPHSHAQNPTDLPPGAPPAFGTAPAVGPEVSAATFAEAEKLVRVELTEKDRAQAAQNWRNSMAALYERRTGPRKMALDASVVPWSQVNPVLPGHKAGPERDRFVRTNTDPGPLPANDADIAFAPVWQLSRWIQARRLTSERLTNIYLARLERFDPKLRQRRPRPRTRIESRQREAARFLGVGGSARKHVALPSVFTPVLAKHSKSFSLIDCISVGVDRMQRNFKPMRKQVEAWQPHPHQISIHYDRCGAAREVTSKACAIRLWTLFASSTTSPSPRSSKSI